MSRFVALLRGVNVGNAKRLPMAEFRACLQALGFTQVATLLNSGNAVFSGAAGEKARYAASIHEQLHQRLGLQVPVLVPSESDFVASIKQFDAECRQRGVKVEDPSRLLFAFVVDAKADLDLEALEHKCVGAEQVWRGKYSLYCHCPAGIADSKLAESLLDYRRYPITSRNLKTVMKLRELLTKDGGS